MVHPIQAFKQLLMQANLPSRKEKKGKKELGIDNRKSTVFAENNNKDCNMNECHSLMSVHKMSAS